jgi:hypothetical protein
MMVLRGFKKSHDVFVQVYVTKNACVFSLQPEIRFDLLADQILSRAFYVRLRASIEVRNLRRTQYSELFSEIDRVFL